MPTTTCIWWSRVKFRRESLQLLVGTIRNCSNRVRVILLTSPRLGGLTMQRQTLVVAVVLASLVLAPHGRARAADNDVNADQVRTAIKKGVAYLKKAQDPKTGRWTDHGGQVGGVTALSTLALIKSGVPVADPAIQESLAFLRTLRAEDHLCRVASDDGVLPGRSEEGSSCD